MKCPNCGCDMLQAVYANVQQKERERLEELANPKPVTVLPKSRCPMGCGEPAGHFGSCKPRNRGW